MPVARKAVQRMGRRHPDTAIGPERRGPNPVVIQSIQWSRRLHKTLRQPQQAAAHADPDTLVAILMQGARRPAQSLLVRQRLEPRRRRRWIGNPEQASAERGDQETASLVAYDTPAWQRQTNGRITTESGAVVQASDDRRAIGHPDVAGLVIDDTLDRGRCPVDQSDGGVFVPVEAACRANPHPSSVVLVSAERLLAIEAIFLGQLRPVTVRESKQTVAGGRPDRTVPILHQPVDALRSSVLR